MEELADNVEALRTQHLDDKNELDVKLFKNLCEIFVSEIDENDAREAMQDYKPENFEQESNNDEEIENFKKLFQGQFALIQSQHLALTSLFLSVSSETRRLFSADIEKMVIKTAIKTAGFNSWMRIPEDEFKTQKDDNLDNMSEVLKQDNLDNMSEVLKQIDAIGETLEKLNSLIEKM
ncbi:hypothetical protein LBMAG43_06300 [Methylococcaceae bacterium]|nr:hypothetical protein LBMAG43_06300 [Methylococcaceae bacterium]